MKFENVFGEVEIKFPEYPVVPKIMFKFSGNMADALLLYLVMKTIDRDCYTAEIHPYANVKDKEKIKYLMRIIKARFPAIKGMIKPLKFSELSRMEFNEYCDKEYLTRRPHWFSPHFDVMFSGQTRNVLGQHLERPTGYLCNQSYDVMGDTMDFRAHWDKKVAEMRANGDGAATGVLYYNPLRNVDMRCVAQMYRDEGIMGDIGYNTVDCQQHGESSPCRQNTCKECIEKHEFAGFFDGGNL